MKKPNLLYLLFIPLCLGWYYLQNSISTDSVFFYGFAENKETEINHDKDIFIDQILVVPGQQVLAGDLLMLVSRAEVDVELARSETDLGYIDKDLELKQKVLVDRIELIETRKANRLESFDLQIKEYQAQLSTHNSLLEKLGLELESSSEAKSRPLQEKIKQLELKKVQERAEAELEVSQIKEQINDLKWPAIHEKKKIEQKKSFVKLQQGKLKVVAPENGIIGNILCKEGENIQSFRTLINFYKPQPTLVKGFVHESQLLEVNMDDELEISSTTNPNTTIKGKVIGLGNRIVEIPERMRKMPEVKTYGREILIRIPEDNPFLQKEKVSLAAYSAANATSKDIGYEK